MERTPDQGAWVCPWGNWYRIRPVRSVVLEQGAGWFEYVVRLQWEDGDYLVWDGLSQDSAVVLRNRIIKELCCT